MRKASVVILLLVYVAFQAGTLSWYFYKPIIHAICYSQVRIRSGNHRNDPELEIKTDITTFLHAKQDDRELLWQGVLYDISDMKVNGNEVLLKVDKDSRETKWMELYNNIQKQLTKDNGSHPLRDVNFYKWLSKLYTAKVDKPATNYLLSPKELFFADPKQYIPSFSADGPSQPPDHRS